MPQGPLESFSKLERELQEERAAALGRIGRTLETLIDRLHSLRERLSAAPESERDALAREYGRVRERAFTYRWYLEVQREAVGLRRHDRLDELYPIPPAMPCHPSAAVVRPPA